MDHTEESKSQAQVRVVGKNAMQNELMAAFIGKETGLHCSQIPQLDLPIVENSEEDIPIVFLLDAKGTDVFGIWDNLDNRLTPRYAELIFTIYNLDPDADVAIEAVDRGIRGIFFSNEPPEAIPKGITAILEGEMWFPRKVMARSIMAARKQSPPPRNSNVKLTKREKEILLRIFSGESNQEIAESLFISYHTVKTHVYNIYQKIDAPDRFQATLWAAKHL